MGTTQPTTPNYTSLEGLFSSQPDNRITPNPQLDEWFGRVFLDRLLKEAEKDQMAQRELENLLVYAHSNARTYANIEVAEIYRQNGASPVLAMAMANVFPIQRRPSDTYAATKARAQSPEDMFALSYWDLIQGRPLSVIKHAMHNVVGSDEVTGNKSSDAKYRGLVYNNLEGVKDIILRSRGTIQGMEFKYLSR